MRLQALGLSRFWAAAIPVLIFAVGYSASGWPNIIVALIAGSILAVFYQWRRDLLTNMIGHFLVDFIGVVVPRFFSQRKSRSVVACNRGRLRFALLFSLRSSPLPLQRFQYERWIKHEQIVARSIARSNAGNVILFRFDLHFDL
jgi:membrane protease YdiL (CAAX protease family)